MPLQDGDFELDGYAMGDDHPLMVLEFLPGDAARRVQDIDSPVSHQRFFGRDLLTGPSWDFTLGTASDDRSTAVSDLAVAARYWRKTAYEPGAESVLRFRLAGADRLIFGRPKKFIYSPTDPLFGSRGFIPADASFQAADPWLYDDALQSMTATLLPSSTGGLQAPLVGSLTSTGGTRTGVIPQVGGDTPAPFTATISGPVANPVISGDGWLIEVRTTLAYDQSLVIDTRKHTVTRNDGASLSGSLTRSSRLTKARLKPGAAAVQFGGVDRTGTASCRVDWRSTYYGF